MDRRTWLQLITILTAAREAQSQQRVPPAAEGAGRGGRGDGGGQNLPMRVTKEQVTGALKLMGLEFQDAERFPPMKRSARRTCQWIPSPPLRSTRGCRTGSRAKGRNALRPRLRRRRR